jgi:hypothetical protein
MDKIILGALAILPVMEVGRMSGWVLIILALVDVLCPLRFFPGVLNARHLLVR